MQITSKVERADDGRYYAVALQGRKRVHAPVNRCGRRDWRFRGVSYSTRKEALAKALQHCEAEVAKPVRKVARW